MPLAVDLDGTLVASDLMLESVLLLARKQPLELLKLPLWLAQGRARLKHHLAKREIPDVRTLPYNRALVDYLTEEKRRGRSLVLATAADEAVARGIAGELRLFDAVYASDGTTNLSGEHKRARLVGEFGARGFDYAGGSVRDRAVWSAARKAILVGPPSALRGLAAQAGTVERVFQTSAFGIGALLSALRVHHWFKNVLVFLPLVADHRLYEAAPLSHALVAFVAFCLCASSVYLLNDLLDLPDDRLHPHKKERMLASGRMSIASALTLIPLLLIGATVLALAQSEALLGVIGIYWLLMLAYCFKLREVLLLDVTTLAGGYTLRAVAGAVAAGLAVAWSLLAFCMLFFFGLALLKRYAELVTMHSIGRIQARAYLARHSGILAVAGCGSGCLALGALAYLLSFDQRTSGRYALIWLLFPLLFYWLAHIWTMARRGRIVADPVTFAIADRPSWLVAALSALIVLLST